MTESISIKIYGSCCIIRFLCRFRCCIWIKNILSDIGQLHIVKDYTSVSRFRFKLRCRHCFRFRGTVTQTAVFARLECHAAYIGYCYRISVIFKFRKWNTYTLPFTVCIGIKFITVLCTFRKSVCCGTSC